MVSKIFYFIHLGTYRRVLEIHFEKYKYENLVEDQMTNY